MTLDLCIVYTGGTFGSVGDQLTPLAGDIFLPFLQKTVLDTVSRQNPKYQNLPNILFNALPALDSSQLDTNNFFALFDYINRLVKQGIKRIILITGTDTLSYLANFLAVGFALEKINLTFLASMQPLLTNTTASSNPQTTDNYTVNQESDALDNLDLALRHTLKTPLIDGVWVACSGLVQPATKIQKTHSKANSAFVSPFLKSKVGLSSQWLDTQYSHDQDLKSLARQLKISSQINKTTPAHIACFYALPAQKSDINNQLTALIAQKPDAIILAAFGTGNFPYSEQIAQTLTSAHQNQILTILSSQVPFGGVQASYQSGSWLQNQHVLSASEYSLPTLYAMLLWLCMFKQDYETRRTIWSSMIQ